MGSICSKSGTHSGGHQVLGGGDSQPPNATGKAKAVGASSSKPANPREAALAAAEERQKAAQARGTNRNNPNAGKLASKLQESKGAVKAPTAREEEVIRWD